MINKSFMEIFVLQCASEPCLNNGTCVDTGSQFRCDCPRGWKGSRCEEEDGLCALNPCHNDAHCVNLVGDYFCVCPEGVSGKNCEIAPNRCLGEPCHNGGVCGDFGSHLECTCPKGAYKLNFLNIFFSWRFVPREHLPF